MKVTGNVWVFYNSDSGKQTKPMSTAQAQMALLNLKSHDLNCIHIWTPGWKNWQNVAEFLKTNQAFFDVTQPPKPEKQGRSKATKVTATDIIDEITNSISEVVTNGKSYTEVDRENENDNSPNYGYHHKDFNGDDLDLSQIRKIKTVKIKTPKQRDTNPSLKRRTTLRHDFKIEIVIISKERSFRTYSKNISLGGTLLEAEIPKDFLNKPFDLIIINRFENEAHKRQLLFKAKIVGDICNPRRLMFLETDPQMMARLNALLKAYVTYQEQIKKKTA